MGLPSNCVHSDMLKHSVRSTSIHCGGYAIKPLPRRRLSILALVVGVLWCPTNALADRTYNQITENILDNNCENLAWSGGTKGIGTQLNVMCNIPNGGNNGVSMGGSTGTAQSLEATLKNRRSDRLEGAPTGRQASLNLLGDLSFYTSGNFKALDRNETTFSNRSDLTILGATMGADFRINHRILTGVAFNYLNRPHDFNNSGELTTDAYGLLSYASLKPTPATFLDISLGYSQYDYVLEKSEFFIEESIGPTDLGAGANQLSGNADNDTDVHEVYFRAASGYDHSFINSIGSGKIGPRITFNYSQLTINPYSASDRNGSAFTSNNQSIRSLQGTIGAQGSMRINTAYGILAPQVTANFVHEFNNDRRNMTGEFTKNQRGAPTKFSLNKDTPDRTFLNLNIGTVLVLPHGILPFLNFSLVTGKNQFDNYAGIIGVRFEGS